jgi:hypothetical protein
MHALRLYRIALSPGNLGPLPGGATQWPWRGVRRHRRRRYLLYTGLDIEETFQRLSVLDENGAPVADQVHLTDIEVDEAR